MQPFTTCVVSYIHTYICSYAFISISYEFGGQDYYNLPLQYGCSLLSLYCVLWFGNITSIPFHSIPFWFHKYSSNFLFAFYVVVLHLHQETEVCSCDKGKTVYGGYTLLDGVYIPPPLCSWLMPLTCKCSLRKITTRFYGFSAAHVSLSLLARI